jgi:hypothetical protein
MTKFLIIVALLAGPSFAEKTGTARPKLAEPPAMEECDASGLQNLIGKPFSEALKEQVLKDSGSRSVRVIRPGQAVTQDYGLQRVNIELDAQEKVISVRCG